MKNGDCHLWQGRLDACGYGEIRLMFRGRRISLKAHRAVFAMSQPDVYLMSPNDDVSHLCFNKNCVKLNHLSLEPHSVNNKRLPCKNDSNATGCCCCCFCCCCYQLKLFVFCIGCTALT